MKVVCSNKGCLNRKCGVMIAIPSLMLPFKEQLWDDMTNKVAVLLLILVVWCCLQMIVGRSCNATTQR